MLLSKLLKYISITSVKYQIDDSHSTLHAMNTLYHSMNMVREEIPQKPFLKNQEKIIYTCALLHDMVDAKYVNTDSAMIRLRTHFRNEFHPEELNTIEKILTTMSYSKVKRHGYPNLGEYQTAYHIVRESDLLGSYDFDRSMVYKIRRFNDTFENSYLDSCQFFQYRVFKLIDDDLFFHDYSKRTAKRLHEDAMDRIWNWKRFYDSGSGNNDNSFIF